MRIFSLHVDKHRCLSWLKMIKFCVLLKCYFVDVYSYLFIQYLNIQVSISIVRNFLRKHVHVVMHIIEDQFFYYSETSLALSWNYYKQTQPFETKLVLNFALSWKEAKEITESGSKRLKFDLNSFIRDFANIMFILYLKIDSIQELNVIIY